MSTAGDGRAPYENGGAGGKFRKRPFRRSVPATPYDRPPTALRNNHPSLLTKLVDPASRLIYAGAHKLFGVFRKRLPPLSLQGPPDVNEGPQNVPQEAERNANNCSGVSELNTDQGGNSAATGISELEQMLQQKTFTRSEIQHLTALLHSKTTEPPSDDVVERDEANPLNSSSPLLRLEASTSASLKTPIVNSKVLQKEIASPAELAKSFMGTRPTKVAPNTYATGLPKTPITSVASKTAISFRGLENGFVTPRSRGRSALYNMARTPYSTGHSTFTQKETRLDYGHGAALTSSQSTMGHEGKMALKRRSSVLDDDIGSGGPLRRTRQKVNLISQRTSLSRDKRELGYTASQRLLLMNGPEPNVSKGYASVPIKSTQTATKILQHLEKPNPSEKQSGSTLSGMKDKSKSPTKLTLDMLHGQALRSLEKVDSPKFLPSPPDSQKSEVNHHARLHDGPELTFQSKEKVEENGLMKSPISHNMLTSVNGDLAIPLKDKAPIVTITDSTLNVPPEPPQKKHAFQMSAPEDLWEVDDDIDIHVNGHVSFPLVDNNKPETSLVSSKPVSADVIQTPTPPEASKTLVSAEATPVFPEVAKISEQTELKEAENSSFSPKTVSEQGTGEICVLPQSTLEIDKVAPEKHSNDISLFATSTEKVSPFQFSANEPLEFKPNASSDPKALDSTIVFGSVTNNNHVKFSLSNTNENGNDQKSTKFSVSNTDENGNDQKSANMFGKSESLSSAVPAVASTSGIFSFGSSSTMNSSAPNTTLASSPPTFPSFSPSPPSGANTNSLFSNSSPNVISASTITTTTAATSSNISTDVPAPAFSFGSTAPTTSMAINEKESKSDTSSSPFATTSFATTTTGSSFFGFSSPAATSTTSNQSQGSFFNITSGSQATTQTSTAVTQSVPFQFGSSIPSSTSGGSVFGSSPSFGIGSMAAASSGTKSGNSTSGPTFGSGFGSTFSSPSSSVFSFGASSTSMPSASSSPAMFGSSNTGVSTGSSMFSFGATNSSFTTPSQSRPVFGNPTPVFGAAATSPNNNNNDQMSMEDSMAEDSMQTPSPVSPFGQSPPAAAPGFMFGSANSIPAPTQTQTQTQTSALSFQFGGQPNQAPAHNPFQSSSLEFNGGGGSFSLGSGGDKSGRRIVRVKPKNRKKGQFQ